MIPEVMGGEVELIKSKDQASQTYHIDIEKGRILGWCDGLEAIKQAAYLILQTERYQYAIYSSNYGVELEDLFGKPSGYAAAASKRRIEDALLQDERIQAIEDFTCKPKGKSLICSFTVKTISGSFQMSKEVAYYV